MPNGKRGRKQASSSRSRGKPRPIKTILREMDVLNPAPQPRRWKKPTRPVQKGESHPLYPMKVPAKIRRMVSQEEWSREVQRRTKEARLKELEREGKTIPKWERLIEEARDTPPAKRNERALAAHNEVRKNKKIIYDLLEKIKKISGRNVLANKKFLELVRKLLVHGLYQAQLQQEILANTLPKLENSPFPISPHEKKRLLKMLQQEIMQENSIKDILTDDEHFVRVARKIHEHNK